MYSTYITLLQVFLFRKYILAALETLIIPHFAVVVLWVATIYRIVWNFRWCKIYINAFQASLHVRHFVFLLSHVLALPHFLICSQPEWHNFLPLQWWEPTMCSRISRLPLMVKITLSARVVQQSQSFHCSCIEKLDHCRPRSRDIYMSHF